MNCFPSQSNTHLSSKICLFCFPSNRKKTPNEINFLEIHRNLKIQHYEPYIPPERHPTLQDEMNSREHPMNPAENVKTEGSVQKSLNLHEKSRRETLPDLNTHKDDGRQGQENDIVCPICFCEISTGILCHEFTLCHHAFHAECVKAYFLEEISCRRVPVKCPNFQCKREILSSDIEFILKDDPKLWAKYQKFYLEYGLSMNPHQYLRCFTTDCEHIWYIDSKPEQQKWTCPQCSQSTCKDCKRLWHPNLSCEKAMKKREKEQDNVFLKFATKRKYQTCPKCNAVIEKVEGCNAMKCTWCMTLFCYYCGSEGDGHYCKHSKRRGLRKNACACSIF